MITTIGLQYAKALFDLATDNNLEQSYFDNLVTLNDIIKSNPDIDKTFKHPSISNDDKKQILNNVLSEKVTNDFLHFLFVLIDNMRFDALEDIIDSYKSYLNEFNKECNAEVFTKYKLDDTEVNNLVKVLEKHFNKKVNLEQTIDENLIGGIVVKVDGVIIDGSIINQMLSLKNELKKGW